MLGERGQVTQKPLPTNLDVSCYVPHDPPLCMGCIAHDRFHVRCERLALREADCGPYLLRIARDANFDFRHRVEKEGHGTVGARPRGPQDSEQNRAKTDFWRLQSKSALCMASDNNVPDRPFICIVLSTSSEAASTVKNRVMFRKCVSRWWWTYGAVRFVAATDP